VNSRNQHLHFILIVAWGAFTAFLLWLPLHFVMAPAGARDHNATLFTTLFLMVAVLMVGWAGFRAICSFFRSSEN
jgi:hypothetical protein